MRVKQAFAILIIMVFLVSCSETYTPKPRGFFRIDFPAKEYAQIGEGYPYLFEIPTYSILKTDNNKAAGKFDANIEIPQNKAKIHITYKNLALLGKTNDERTFTALARLTEESRKFVYDHTIKADAIDEKIYLNREKQVFGTIYFIEGNAASSIQFYLTDSTHHFLRGALYINEVPNMDSIRPVLDFLKPDIVHLIETTSWN